MKIGNLRLAPVAHYRKRSRLARGLRQCGYCGRTMMGRHVRRLPNDVWRCNQRWACELVRWRLREVRAGRDPWDEDGRRFQAVVTALAATEGATRALEAIDAYGAMEATER